MIAANRTWLLVQECKMELSRSKVKPLSRTKYCFAHCEQLLFVSPICDLNLYMLVRESTWNPLFHTKTCLLSHTFLLWGMKVLLKPLRG